MRRTRLTRTIATAGLLALLAAGCGGREDSDEGGATANDPGITDTEIKLGSSYPFSGPSSAASASGTAVGAYWKYVNEEKGGIKSADGKTRTITWTALDDVYQPARAVENVRRLVESDQVFAVFNPLGTPNNTAIHDYMNAQKVPHLFVYSGAEKFYSDISGHPWTMGWQVPYPVEARVYAEYLKGAKPGAKVAVLFQNDDFGKDFLTGFERGIAGSGVTIAARESYVTADPSVDAQVFNLARSAADTFFIAGTQRPTTQALRRAANLGWKPTTFVTSVSASVAAVLGPAGPDASTGVLTGAYYKDPGDPRFATDPAIVEYRRVLGKYCPSCNPNDNLHVAGFTVAQMMEKTLEGLEEPTRQALMDSARSQSDVEIPLLLPGITMDTAEDDGYPLEAMQIMQFNGTSFQLTGGVIDVTGKRG